MAFGNSVSSASGYVDGVGTTALFGHNGKLAIDGYNQLFVADSDNAVIRKISLVSGWFFLTYVLPC